MGHKSENDNAIIIGFIIFLIICLLLYLFLRVYFSKRNESETRGRRQRKTSQELNCRDMYWDMTRDSHRSGVQPLVPSTEQIPLNYLPHSNDNQEIHTNATNVTVNGQPISASPVVVPPYPIDARHPVPQQVAPPAPGFATHNPPYPTHTPHPMPASLYYPPPVGSTPYPPAGGAPYPSVSGNAPYPPAPIAGTAPYPDYSTQPPSYSEAVAQPPLPVSTKEGYFKQAPYNPNY